MKNLLNAIKATWELVKACGSFLLALVLSPFRPQAAELRKAASEGRKPRSTWSRALGAIGLASAFLFLVAAQGHSAATTIAVSKMGRAGTTQTASTMDFSNGNRVFLASDDIFLLFVNPGATSTTITASDYLVSDQGVTQNATIAVHGGATVVSGPWKTGRWRDTSGYLQLFPTGLTTTTIRALRLPMGEPDRQTN